MKKHPAKLVNLTAWFFLLLYGASFLGAEVLHQFFHANEHINLHTPEQESNVCHIAQYHQGKDCGHETHIDKSQPCDLCQIAHHIDSFVDVVCIQSISAASKTSYFYFATEIPAVSLHTHTGRGPPAIS